MEIPREHSKADTENPLLILPSETIQFLRFLRGRVMREPEDGERELTMGQLGTKRFIESLRATGIAKRIPGLSAKELDAVDYAPTDEAGKAELARVGQLVSAAIGTPPNDLMDLARDPRLSEYLNGFPEARQAQLVNMIRELWGRIANGETGVAQELIAEMNDGTRPSEEIAPMPPKGEFAFLEDRDPKEPGNPVRVYERQIVRTNRDVESPAFSSCASVVLYREGPDGSPEQETLFAHLPPKAYGDSGRQPDFNDYTPDFLAAKTGLASLVGYKAKVSAGLRLSPDAIARSLRALGADVLDVRRIPMDMYTLRLDAKTKTMVAKGHMERVTRAGESPSYRTVDGVPITIDARFEETVSV